MKGTVSELSGLSEEILTIVAILVASVISALILITLQKRGKIKHLFRAMLGMILGMLSFCLIVLRLLFGQPDIYTLIVDLPVMVIGAVFFCTSVHWKKQRTAN